MPMRVRGCALGLLLLTVTACYDGPTDLAEASDGRAVGVVGFYHADLPNITLPDHAEVGEEVVLLIDTWGNECRSLGPDEVRYGTRRVVVTPYDLVRTPNGPCADILLRFRHRVPLTFSETGPHRVTVIARFEPGGPLREFDRQIMIH